MGTSRRAGLPVQHRCRGSDMIFVSGHPWKGSGESRVNGVEIIVIVIIIYFCKSVFRSEITERFTTLPTCFPSPWRSTIIRVLEKTSSTRYRLSLSSTTTNRTKMKIAVLTSGGDSAGMNAVVRGVVRAGIARFAASFSVSPTM